jgi:hypothetical protein
VTLIARSVKNTIAKPEITFAMIELAESADSNSRKTAWMNYGFKDVTPKFAAQGSVPSLNGKNIASGRDMLDLMKSVNADWYMVSGHQGALYQSDYYRFIDDQGIRDDIRLTNEQEYCGFFNEAYHEGRWDHSTRADPDAAHISKPDPNAAQHHADEIYLRTTPAAPSDIAYHPQTNPLMDGDAATQTARAGRCKGVILSACNTTIYLAARKTWAAAFPTSVIIGNFTRIVSGTWTTNAIAGAALTDENFWRDPQSILDQDGKCEELARQMMKNFPGRDSPFGISLAYKGTFYIPMRDLKTGKIDVHVQPVTAPFKP